MTTPQPFSGLYTDAETECFFDSPTIVGNSENDTEMSQSGMQTEIMSLDELPAESSRVQAPLRTQAPMNDAYQVTHEIGVGGYGAIWNGTQKNLHRRVALKTLKADLVGKPQQEKMTLLFRQEAITTAYLQHPNVVPVYDLTEDVEGLPILAMKLVEGRQWNRVLADDFAKLAPLEFLEHHLPVLISVTQAVAYAHSRGIIHRDLKPSQIMIGNYSEVLLMDWGLAMAARDGDGQVLCDPAIIIDAQSPLIKPMTPAGTPGYMAPEQKSKDASTLGAWTDVYLLGAILYELLTGLRPHKPSDKPVSLAELDPGEVIKPEQRTPGRDIPAQLSALAMRALAPAPRDRVAGASEFAEELKDYLIRAGRRGESMELVTSVANSVIADEHTYEQLQNCLEKLDRAHAQWPENQMATYLRHQVLVTFSRTALGNNDLKLARLQADRIKISHERNSILREIEAAELDFKTRDIQMSAAQGQAREERGRAEALVRFLLLDLNSELRTLGRVDLVHQVASEALNFFDSLKGENLDKGTLQNRCIACAQVGDVLSEQGRRDEAETGYGRALSIAEGLVAANPADRSLLKLKAQCLGCLGRLHYIMGKMDLAQKEYERSLQLQRQILKGSTGDPEIRRSIANTVHSLALILWRKQEYDAALQKLSESITYTRTFYSADPSNVNHQTDLAVYLASQSNILRDAGDVDGALEAINEALSMRIALSDQFPGNAIITEEVYWVRATLGTLLLKRGEMERVLTNLKADLAARRRMYEQDPLNILRTMGLTYHLSLLAEASFLLEKTDEAERLMAECLVHSLRLANLDNLNPGAVSRYAFHLIQMAELLASRGQWTEAERLGAQGLAKARASYDLAPDNSSVFRPLFQAMAFNARICMRQAKHEKAAQLEHECREILGKTKGDRDSAEHRSLQARVDFGTLPAAELSVLIKRLVNDRRMDPYLAAWAQELNLGSDSPQKIASL